VWPGRGLIFTHKGAEGEQDEVPHQATGEISGANEIILIKL
jgi:hypothetical protein